MLPYITLAAPLLSGHTCKHCSKVAGYKFAAVAQDFTIPYEEEKCSFVVKGPAIWHDNDTWVEQPIQTIEVGLA